MKTLFLVLFMAAQAPQSEGPWRLVPLVGDWANFAWRINQETGEVQGFRVVRGDGEGDKGLWMIQSVRLTCGDDLSDRVRRGVLDAEKATQLWISTCKEPEK